MTIIMDLINGQSDKLVVLNEKTDKISDLLKRETERQLDLKKKQNDRKLTKPENEKIDYFDKEFNQKIEEIENDFINLNNLEISKLADQFDCISKKIIVLQKFVANSNIFLRVYDIKKYQRILNELSNKCNKLEEELMPKKKFSFKNRVKSVPVHASRKKVVVDEVDSCSSPKYKITCGFENKSNEVLQLGKEEEISKKDIRLENLTWCTVKIYGNPSTINISHLENCTILSGPVSTSIFANNCKNCIFVIACQQLRLHSSNKIDIYLHVTSRAIIEDSSDITFAPYNLIYENIDRDFDESGFCREQNNWMAIDDFNWLNVDKTSPNWRISDENCKRTSWEM